MVNASAAVPVHRKRERIDRASSAASPARASSHNQSPTPPAGYSMVGIVHAPSAATIAMLVHVTTLSSRSTRVANSASTIVRHASIVYPRAFVE